MSSRKNDDQTGVPAMVYLVDGSGSIAIPAWFAASLRDRTRGLLGRTSIDADVALLLRAKHVHSFGMSFPIDVVCLDGGFKVLAVARLEPGRLGPFRFSTRWILEMAAGAAEDSGITPGLQLEARWRT